MAWLVIARVDGIGGPKEWPRIVADTSWKGWPKVKDFAGNVVHEHRMSGKNVVHVIGESEDGKTIAPGLLQPARSQRPLVVPPEAQEIVSRKTAPPPAVQEIGPDGKAEEVEKPVVASSDRDQIIETAPLEKAAMRDPEPAKEAKAEKPAKEEKAPARTKRKYTKKADKAHA